MRIAHISDTHLGYRQYNLYERENDFYEVFNEAIDTILKERVDVIIHSGDLFDSSTPPIKALKVFKDCMEKVDGKAKFVSILGDHDTPRRRGLYPHSLFDNVKVLGIGELEYVDLNGVLIAGISNLRGRGIEVLRNELMKFDSISKNYGKSILIMHQAIDRYLPFEGAYEIRENELPRSASYYALGHLHFRVVNRFGGGFLAYAGSTEIANKGEVRSWRSDGKGFYIVDLDGDEPLIHKFNLNVRPQADFELNVMSDLDMVKALKIIDDNLRELSSLSSKIPIIHLTVKCRDADRQRVMNSVNRHVKGRILSLRVNFIGDSTPISISSIKSEVNYRALIYEYLKSRGLSDEKFLNLALELQEHLVNDEIDEAKEIVKKFFGVE